MGKLFFENKKMPEHIAHISSSTKKIGWSYNLFEGDKVEIPSDPIFTGTISHICRKIKGDRTRNVNMIECWFYRGIRIIGIDDGVYASTDQRDIDTIIKALDQKGATVYLAEELPKGGRPRKMATPETFSITLDAGDRKILDSLGKNRSQSIRDLLRSLNSPTAT